MTFVYKIEQNGTIENSFLQPQLNKKLVLKGGENGVVNTCFLVVDNITCTYIGNIIYTCISRCTIQKWILYEQIS